MQSTSLPAKIDLVWGYNSAGAYSRTIPATTSDQNAASWALGFPPNTFIVPDAGGAPPDGRDFNGAFAAISGSLLSYQAMGLFAFDSNFADAIGGYPKGALVCDPNNLGIIWQSTAENNYTTPGASAQSLWQSVMAGYVPLPGGTMSGILTVDTHNGSDASGDLRWGGNIQSQIKGYEYNWLGLYMCEVVNQYPFANLQVNGANNARTDFHFRQDTARIETVSNAGSSNPTVNTVAFLSDFTGYATQSYVGNQLQNYALISQLPMDPSQKIETFTASGLGNGNTWVTFPSAFSSAPIVMVGALGQNGNSTDTDYFVWGATGSGVNINPRNVTSQVQIIAIGPK